MRVRVRVFRRADRRHYEAQWTDPVTRRKKTRTTGCDTRRDALRVAARIEAELEEGRFRAPLRTTWAEFRKRLEAEVLAAQAPSSRAKVAATLNAIELHVNPMMLAALDAAAVSRFQSALRAKDRLAEPTIKSHLVCLRAALRWAERVGLLEQAPSIDMPRGVGGMKGRPITREEFERCREAVAACLAAELVGTWQFLLDGLWNSGLRLGEALQLDWKDDRRLCVELAGRRPMFRIQAASEKGKRFRLLPMAPEFAKQLAEVPEAERRGRVFRPRGPEGLDTLSLNWVSKMIGRFGERAGVKVAERDAVDARGKRFVSLKFASAHDFRRAFGFRWSMRVMPPVLMEMMRHESIQTTMQFYVGRNAEAAADALWAAYGRAGANETANRVGDQAAFEHCGRSNLS